MSPPTKGEIKNGQSRETDNKWYTGHEKQKHNTICVGFQFMMILFVKLTKGIGNKFYQLMKSSSINMLDTTMRKQTQII